MSENARLSPSGMHTCCFGFPLGFPWNKIKQSSLQKRQSSTPHTHTLKKKVDVDPPKMLFGFPLTTNQQGFQVLESTEFTSWYFDSNSTHLLNLLTTGRQLFLRGTARSFLAFHQVKDYGCRTPSVPYIWGHSLEVGHAAAFLARHLLL